MKQSDFTIGDRWLYYKIYLGPKTGDIFLSETIPSLIKTLILKKLIIKWFFIRYNDPENHLRLRFELSDLYYLGEVISIIQLQFRELINQDLIWRIQTDTYRREIGRYGLNTIDIAEEIFHHDSNLVLNILSNLQDLNTSEESRWLISLKEIDNKLNDFEYNLEQKCNLLKDLKNSFGYEFGMSRTLKQQIDQKYRFFSQRIELFIEKPISDNIFTAESIKLRQTYHMNIKLEVKNLLNMNKQNLLEERIDNMIKSYIHMFMNRLFSSKNRIYELVCYDFLFRYYSSKIAKQKYS